MNKCILRPQWSSLQCTEWVHRHFWHAYSNILIYKTDSINTYVGNFKICFSDRKTIILVRAKPKCRRGTNMAAMNWFQNWNAYSSTYFTIFRHPTISFYVDELSVRLRSVITNTLIYIYGISRSLGLRQLLYLHIFNTEFNSNTWRNTLQSMRPQFSLNPQTFLNYCSSIAWLFNSPHSENPKVHWQVTVLLRP